MSSYTRGDVLWVEVKSQPGWWPARVKKVPPRVPEGHLAIRFFGSREIKEVEVDSECMAFDEPVVGENLQNMQPSEFEANDVAQHAKFKAAVAEAQACLAGSGPAPSEDETDLLDQQKELLKLTLPQLQEKARALGTPVTGTKAKLVQMIMDPAVHQKQKRRPTADAKEAQLGSAIAKKEGRITPLLYGIPIVHHVAHCYPLSNHPALTFRYESDEACEGTEASDDEGDDESCL